MRSSSATSFPSAYVASADVQLAMSDDDEDGAATVTWRMESTFDRLTRIHPNHALQQQPQPTVNNAASSTTPSPASKRRRSASNPFTLPIAIHWERGKERRERRQRSADKRKAALIAAGTVKQLPVKEEDKENTAPTAIAAVSSTVTPGEASPLPTPTPTQSGTLTTSLPPSSPLSLFAVPTAQSISTGHIDSTVLRVPSVDAHSLHVGSHVSPSTALPTLSTATAMPSSTASTPATSIPTQLPLRLLPAFTPTESSNGTSVAISPAPKSNAPPTTRRRLPVRSLTRAEPPANALSVNAVAVTAPAVHRGVTSTAAPANSAVPPFRPAAPVPPPSTSSFQPISHLPTHYTAAGIAPAQSVPPTRQPPPSTSPSAPAAPVYSGRTASYPYSVPPQPLPPRSVVPPVAPSVAAPTVPLPSHHPLPPPTAASGSSHYHYHFSSRPTHAHLSVQQPRLNVQPAAAAGAASTHAPPHLSSHNTASHQSLPPPPRQPAVKLQPHVPATTSTTATTKQYPLPPPHATQYRPVVKQEPLHQHQPAAPTLSSPSAAHPTRATGITATVRPTSTAARSSFFADDDDEDELMALSQAYDAVVAPCGKGG